MAPQLQLIQSGITLAAPVVDPIAFPTVFTAGVGQTIYISLCLFVPMLEAHPDPMLSIGIANETNTITISYAPFVNLEVSDDKYNFFSAYIPYVIQSERDFILNIVYDHSVPLPGSGLVGIPTRRGTHVVVQIHAV